MLPFLAYNLTYCNPHSDRSNVYVLFSLPKRSQSELFVRLDKFSQIHTSFFVLSSFLFPLLCLADHGPDRQPRVFRIFLPEMGNFPLEAKKRSYTAESGQFTFITW